ncbi:hypothetical protein Gohar_019670, partial [Gossypium harknessii]|nr:hypothetical protein [Gossypium harknessii]
NNTTTRGGWLCGGDGGNNNGQQQQQQQLLAGINRRVCVDKWVNTCKKNCPICRFSMGEEDRFMFHRREAFTEEMMIWFSSFHIAGF